jgi:hypothetical protein
MPDESRLDGRWELRGGRVVTDPVCDRIAAMVKTRLEVVATTGWDTLHRDPEDGRYWEVLYLHSEMHGGDPPSLVQVARDAVREKYGLDV